MNLLIEIIFLCISFVIAIPGIFLFIECIAALLPFPEEIMAERSKN